MFQELDAWSHSWIADRRARFGTKLVWGRLLLVIGEVSCSLSNQLLMASPSYVKPSAATCGSSITSYKQISGYDLSYDYNSLIMPFSLIFALMALTCVMGHMKYWGGPWFLRLLLSFDTSLSSIFNSSCSCLSLLTASIDKVYLYWSFLIIFSSSSFVVLSAFSVSFLHFSSLIYTFSDCLAYILLRDIVRKSLMLPVQAKKTCWRNLYMYPFDCIRYLNPIIIFDHTWAWKTFSSFSYLRLAQRIWRCTF